jgi:hypothetical protein
MQAAEVHNCANPLSPAAALNQAEPGSSRWQQAVGVLAQSSSSSSSGEGGSISPPCTALLTIHAPIVVTSCGSIHTPALLLRSGIRVGGQVGANLRVHPASGVVAVFPATPEQQASGRGAVEMQQVRLVVCGEAATACTPAGT